MTTLRKGRWELNADPGEGRVELLARCPVCGKTRAHREGRQVLDAPRPKLSLRCDRCNQVRVYAPQG